MIYCNIQRKYFFCCTYCIGNGFEKAPVVTRYRCNDKSNQKKITSIINELLILIGTCQNSKLPQIFILLLSNTCNYSDSTDSLEISRHLALLMSPPSFDRACCWSQNGVNKHIFNQNYSDIYGRACR